MEKWWLEKRSGEFFKIVGVIIFGAFVYGFLAAFLFYDFQNKICRISKPVSKENISDGEPDPNRPLPIVIHAVKRISDKGLYITESTACNELKFGAIRAEAKQAGLNTLVIDVKDAIGKKFLELAQNRQLKVEMKIAADPWLYHLTEKLHREGFIVTARIVVFKDDPLILARPDLAIQMKAGGIYRDNRGGRWADPYAVEVQIFNRLIAETAAASGVDEVQFDYIRFPAEGAAGAIFCSFNKEGLTKVEIINQFLAAVRDRLQKYNVALAVDIFGVTAWQNPSDIRNLGQDLKSMARSVDVISPMLYPSHFHNGYDGYPNPGAEPYYFINAGVKKSFEILGPESKTQVIPWIQGFYMKSPNFGPGYILEQVRAAREAGTTRFLIWNAGNVYDVSFEAFRQKPKTQG